MSNKDLFEQAIADAKAVREAALANAKAALEESFTPKIQSMLAAKLNEMEDENEIEEGMYPEDTNDEIQDQYRATGAALEEEELDEEIDLSAILAELNAEDETEELEEAKDKEGGDEKEKEKEEKDEVEAEEEPIEISDMTVEELKDLIKDIVSQEMGGGEEDMMNMGDEAGEEMPIGDEMASSEEEEINLDELLAELDALDETEELEEGKKKAKKDEKEDKAKETEMKEALETINILRKELNEVNLLNAKLLYVNKIFKSKNLSESQKVQVIASFDKATNVKEAKVVFESLNTALAAIKKPIKESLGFASKAAGVAPQKQQIVESNDVVSRMQKLANIIK